MGVAVDDAGSWNGFAGAYEGHGRHWDLAHSTGETRMVLYKHNESTNTHAQSTNLTVAQWATIAASAHSDDTDSEFYAVIYGMVPGFAGSHVANSISAFRQMVVESTPQV